MDGKLYTWECLVAALQAREKAKEDAIRAEEDTKRATEKAKPLGNSKDVSTFVSTWFNMLQHTLMRSNIVQSHMT